MAALLWDLLEDIIDYAGLFPPARLSMAESVERYFGFRGGPESWLVNRFVCPAARLAELGSQLREGKPMPLTVIGTGGANYDAFQDGLAADAAAMTAFEADWDQLAPIEAYEVRLPPGAPLAKVLPDLHAFDKVEVYLELPWSASLDDQLAEVAEEEWLSVKARTGGADASAFPSSADLAGLLKGCQDLDLPFKLTAGLHHLAPTREATLGVRMHGFGHILAAMALNDALDLNRGEMAAVLDADEVVWRDDGVHVQGLSASAEECEDVRMLFVGFGSCSVDEPMEDLRAVGAVGGVSV